MAMFDAPTREACAVRRARTNTPLQALALMNDTQFVEAARAFAARVLREGGPNDAGRAALAFRLATARAPERAETDVLLRLLEAERASYREAPEEAKRLVGVGASEPPSDVAPEELAAWTCVTSAILNLDEVVTAK